MPLPTGSFVPTAPPRHPGGPITEYVPTFQFDSKKKTGGYVFSVQHIQNHLCSGIYQIYWRVKSAVD